MPLPTCPACGRPTLQRHCPATNPGCPWDYCTDPDCRATVDRVTGRHSHPIHDACATCGTVPRARKWGERT